MNAFERWSVWVTSVLTAVTGLVYLWMKYLLPVPDAWSVVNHPLQPLVLKAHIIVSPLLVFAVGLIFMRHVWRHFQSRVSLGRRSGILTALLLGPMVVSGYLIQVMTSLGWVRAFALAHIALGLLYVVLFTAHLLVIRRRAREVRTQQEARGVGLRTA